MLQRRHQLFEGGGGRIFVAAVAVSFFLVPEDAVELFHRFVEEAGTRVNGRGDGNVRARLLPVARMHGLGVNLHRYFLFQRIPDLVSSRIIPSARSSSRI